MGCPELPAKRCEHERMLCRSALLLWVLNVLPLSMMSSMTVAGVRAGTKAWGAGFCRVKMRETAASAPCGWDSVVGCDLALGGGRRPRREFCTDGCAM